MRAQWGMWPSPGDSHSERNDPKASPAASAIVAALPLRSRHDDRAPASAHDAAPSASRVSKNIANQTLLRFLLLQPAAFPAAPHAESLRTHPAALSPRPGPPRRRDARRRAAAGVRLSTGEARGGGRKAGGGGRCAGQRWGRRGEAVSGDGDASRLVVLVRS